MSTASCVVNRIRKMVSFEFGKEIEKGVFCLVTSVGEEQILSPHEESGYMFKMFTSDHYK